MSGIKNIEAALDLCRDESKVLVLTVGTQKIAPGKYIPKKV